MTGWNLTGRESSAHNLCYNHLIWSHPTLALLLFLLPLHAALQPTSTLAPVFYAVTDWLSVVSAVSDACSGLDPGEGSCCLAPCLLPFHVGTCWGRKVGFQQRHEEGQVARKTEPYHQIYDANLSPLIVLFLDTSTLIVLFWSSQLFCSCFLVT